MHVLSFILYDVPTGLLVTAEHDDQHQVCHAVVGGESELFQRCSEPVVWKHEAGKPGFVLRVHADVCFSLLHSSGTRAQNLAL